jgi:hypothetical protein
MTDTQPLANQQLTPAEIRLAQYGQRTSTWSTATYNDGTEKALHEIALGLKAEVDRLRAELAASRASALNAGADAIDDMERRNAWPVRPVGAGVCSEFLRGMAAGSQPAGPDTLPAWLYQRFAVIHGCPPWDRTTDRDRAYWEHQAAAVRRAVARGGFKTTERATVPAAVETGE